MILRFDETIHTYKYRLRCVFEQSVYKLMSELKSIYWSELLEAIMNDKNIFHLGCLDLVPHIILI